MGIHGAVAGRDLPYGDHLVDLIGRSKVIRMVGAPICAGDRLEVRADGRVYPMRQCSECAQGRHHKCTLEPCECPATAQPDRTGNEVWCMPDGNPV